MKCSSAASKVCGVAEMTFRRLIISPTPWITRTVEQDLVSQIDYLPDRKTSFERPFVMLSQYRQLTLGAPEEQLPDTYEMPARQGLQGGRMQVMRAMPPHHREIGRPSTSEPRRNGRQTS